MFHPSREDGLTRFANLHRNKEIPNIRTDMKSFPETSQCSIPTSADHWLVMNIKKSQQHIITTKTRVKHCPVMSSAITPHVLVSQPRLPTRYANQTIMFFFEAWVFQCLYLVASPHFGYKTHASQPESHSMNSHLQHVFVPSNVNCPYFAKWFMTFYDNVALDIASTTTGIPKFPCHQGILTSHQGATTKRERQNSTKAKPWTARKNIWESSKQKASWGKHHRQLWQSLVHPPSFVFAKKRQSSEYFSTDEYCRGATCVGFQKLKLTETFCLMCKQDHWNIQDKLRSNSLRLVYQHFVIMMLIKAMFCTLLLLLLLLETTATTTTYTTKYTSAKTATTTNNERAEEEEEQEQE